MIIIGIIGKIGSGKTYIANKITKFDVSDHKCKVACEVPQSSELENPFLAEQWIDKKELILAIK